MTSSLRIVFMGAPDFAARHLRALLDAGETVAAVYTQPPRPAGRGKKPRPTAVDALATDVGLPVHRPVSLKPQAEIDALRALEPDIAVVVAYGLLLPRSALDAPRLGAVNVHASLLPRWRGAAPIHRAIMAGDAETGVCVMRMTEGLDEGPVILSEATPIGPEETTGTLHDRLAAIGAPLLLQALSALANGDAAETPQPETGSIYAKKISKEEAFIGWGLDAASTDAKIRGLSPSPGAWSMARLEPDGAPERLKLLASRVEPTALTGSPGTSLDDRLLIAAGTPGAAVRLLRVQRAGRAAQDADAFLRGAPAPAGATLFDTAPPAEPAA